jgi:acetyl esterase
VLWIFQDFRRRIFIQPDTVRFRDEAKDYADALERAGVKVRYICHEHMNHHFYAMAGAIPYAKTALEVAGVDIKAALEE